MPYRCRDCRAHFSVRKGTVMQSSKLGHRKWVLAIYAMTTEIKGTASNELFRRLDIQQRSAWYLMQRIREGFLGETQKMGGEVEVDETYVGGLRKNMHAAKRKAQPGEGGPAGKAVVVAVRERGSRRVVARVVDSGSGREVWPFIDETVKKGSLLYTDHAPLYKTMKQRGYRHASVNHSAGEYVREQVHVNGLESFWAIFKRGYKGTFHKLSNKHLHRYVREFAGRHNIRDLDTIEQMRVLARGMIGRRLRYRELMN